MDFTPKSYTLKLDEEGAIKLNEVLDNNNLTPVNFKELFYNLLELVNAPKTAVEPEVREVIKEIEKEVTKEVPAELKPNQCIIDFSELQLETLDKVRKNRIKYREYYRQPEKDEPNDVLIKNWIFNKGILHNFGETFYTGLK